MSEEAPNLFGAFASQSLQEEAQIFLLKYLGALSKTTKLNRLKLNRSSLACILGVLLLSRSFWAGWIVTLVRDLLPSSGKTSKSDQTEQAEQALLDCRADILRNAILTIFAGEEIGTGSVVSRSGLVLTNEHVVREVGSGGEIRARQWGGRLYKGWVLASNPTHDLALVKINTPAPLPTIAFAEPQDMQKGQAVCALGSPRAITGVLARGTLIGTRGSSDLQSKIMLQPGNSGGPLLNEQGRMIGVNKSIWLSANGENMNRGFATDATVANQFLEQNRDAVSPVSKSPIAGHAIPVLMHSEPLDYSLPVLAETPSRPEPLQPLASGARLGALVDSQTLVIQIVEPESPAEKAGLNAGDLLIKVNGQSLHQIDDLNAFLATRRDRATFTVSRDSKLQNVIVEFGASVN